MLGPMAAELGCAVLAPDSRGPTWDAVTGAFIPDVRFLERALAQVAVGCEVAPGRVAAAGFSLGPRRDVSRERPRPVIPSAARDLAGPSSKAGREGPSLRSG